MAGIENDVLVGKNLNFDNAGPKPHLGILNAAGKLPIGTGNTSPTPEILAGKIISPLGTLAIGYSSPNITMDLVGGIVAAEHLTGDSGGTLNPDAGNNFNLLGQQAGTVSVMDTIGLGSTIKFENRTWTTPLVVDPSATVGLRGTFQTIQAAVTAASAGQDVFVRPGSYTENLTLKAGVNIIGYTGDANTPQVTIIGTVGAAYSGTATISNVRLQTNSANLISLTGANATILNVFGCYLNATNADGISSTGSNASAQVNLNNCLGDLGTTGIKIFNVTNGGLEMRICKFTNSGASLTASTMSGAGLSLRYCTLASAITTSGTTATIGIRYCALDSDVTNQTMITHGSTNAGTCQIYNCFIASGTSSAVSIGAGAQCQFYDNVVSSSNANAITGSGTLLEANTIFSSTSLTNNVSTLTKKASSGISFDATNTLGTYATTTWTPTITGSGSNPTPTYTLQSGTYIKIGKLVFVHCQINVSALTGGTGFFQISGLPFTSENTNNWFAGWFQTNVIIRTIYQIGASSTIVNAVLTADASATALQLPQTTTTVVQFSGCYIAST